MSLILERFFGIPWNCEQFINQVCATGHPILRELSLSKDV